MTSYRILVETDIPFFSFPLFCLPKKVEQKRAAGNCRKLFPAGITIGALPGKSSVHTRLTDGQVCLRLISLFTFSAFLLNDTSNCKRHLFLFGTAKRYPEERGENKNQCRCSYAPRRAWRQKLNYLKNLLSINTLLVINSQHDTLIS